ncbi:Transcription factor IIA, alpha/beta subunit [Elaphomyces granulatus]
MSNTQVGTVFDRVIHDVCEASQVDFEESGVDQQTLEELRKIWQQKLSSLGVAHFPWDPPLESSATPQPQQQQQQPQSQPQQSNSVPPAASTPSNVPRPPSSQQQGPSQLPQPAISPVSSSVPGPVPTTASAANVNGQPPRIKLEPGVNGQSGLPTMNAIPPSSNAQAIARERAANMLNSKYGAAAANSVSQLQAQSHAALSLPGQQRLQNAHLPNGQVSDVKTPQSYQNLQQAQRTSVGNSQTDGADETLVQWKAEVAQRREAAKRQNGQGDRLLREHLVRQELRLESGGLMRPLDQHHHLMGKSGFSSNLPGVPDAACQLRPVPPAVTSPPNRSNLPRSQYDGINDDGDEDAINSDLDDPDDLVAEEHDSEDAVGEVMLCTYDKVQRVKNKWKCTLKDGILTTGGKEYVFHKAQGEFEW